MQVEMVAWPAIYKLHMTVEGKQEPQSVSLSRKLDEASDSSEHGVNDEALQRLLHWIRDRVRELSLYEKTEVSADYQIQRSTFIAYVLDIAREYRTLLSERSDTDEVSMFYRRRIESLVANAKEAYGSSSSSDTTDHGEPVHSAEVIAPPEALTITRELIAAFGLRPGTIFHTILSACIGATSIPRELIRAHVGRDTYVAIYMGKDLRDRIRRFGVRPVGIHPQNKKGVTGYSIVIEDRTLFQRFSKTNRLPPPSDTREEPEHEDTPERPNLTIIGIELRCQRLNSVLRGFRGRNRVRFSSKAMSLLTVLQRSFMERTDGDDGDSTAAACRTAELVTILGERGMTDSHIINLCVELRTALQRAARSRGVATGTIEVIIHTARGEHPVDSYTDMQRLGEEQEDA